VPAKKAKKAGQSKNGKRKSRPCKDKNVCDFLEKELNPYLMNDLWPDIRALRRAVCNLERVALDGKASNDSKRLCTGSGGGDEPADPPKPPQW